MCQQLLTRGQPCNIGHCFSTLDFPCTRCNWILTHAGEGNSQFPPQYYGVAHSCLARFPSCSLPALLHASPWPFSRLVLVHLRTCHLSSSKGQSLLQQQAAREWNYSAVQKPRDRFHHWKCKLPSSCKDFWLTQLLKKEKKKTTHNLLFRLTEKSHLSKIFNSWSWILLPL